MKVTKHAAVSMILGLFASGVFAQTLQPWMSTDLSEAWGAGFKGQGVTITVIDDFRSQYGYYGNLSGTTELLRHGQWTSKEASLVAPLATIKSQDFSLSKSVSLSRGLNVLNLSYGMMAQDGYSAIRWSSRESSIITYAQDGKAVIAKAAGNDGVDIGKANSGGQVDYLARDLIGKQSAIFAGALDKNGSVGNKASLAHYSNKPGTDTVVQKQFLAVGVEGDKTGLYGTSFAAPVIAGYAAVIGSKFTKATSTQITNQLLNTARQDTIAGYDSKLHGRGEASISRAIAPLSIR